MLKYFQTMPVMLFLIVATALEVTGDALIRKAIFNHEGMMRLALLSVGGLCLLGYGVTLNLAPLEFGRVVGLYIVTLFLMWQLGNFLAFHTVPTLPILLGGSLIVAGGLVVTYWK